MNSDGSFENNYIKKNHIVSENAKINGIDYNTWLNKAQIEMNGSGFKFGSTATSQSIGVKKIDDYCVAFDHKGKGFDNNDSKKCVGYISNCAAFNSNINYHLPYVFEGWLNNWNWNPIEFHQFRQSQKLQSPKDKSQATKNFYSIRDKIIHNCQENKFSDITNFDAVINALK